MINLKTLHGNVVALIFLCYVSACSSPVPKHQPPPPPPAPPDNLDICKGDPIPPGWVIANEVTIGGAGCRGEIHNGWHVKIPGDKEIVCLDSPLPDGYTIVGRSMYSACPGSGYNAKNIQKL